MRSVDGGKEDMCCSHVSRLVMALMLDMAVSRLGHGPDRWFDQMERCDQLTCKLLLECFLWAAEEVYKSVFEIGEASMGFR